MVEVEFLYKEQNIIFNCDLNSKLKSIFKNFEKYAKIDDDMVNIYYFYDEMKY
jgi:CRISPR/Cas system-associated endoribonuclease Cas2